MMNILFRFSSLVKYLCCLLALMAINGRGALLPAQQPSRFPVNEVHHDAPADLANTTLLIPAFDLVTAGPEATPRRKAYVDNVNAMAEESNASLKKVISKTYPFSYELTSIAEVESYKQKGYRYFLDMVIMPKQMTRVKKAAMVSTYRKYETANRMYRNENYQFQFYFYIRDLQTDDAYMGTRMRGNADVYPGIKKFLKEIVKDLE